MTHLPFAVHQVGSFRGKRTPFVVIVYMCLLLLCCSAAIAVRRRDSRSLRFCNTILYNRGWRPGERTRSQRAVREVPWKPPPLASKRFWPENVG